MHVQQHKSSQHKGLLWRIKLRLLKITMGMVFRTPVVGKRGKKNAKKMFFHTQKIPLDVTPQLQGMSLLFLTDPHIGGSIDAMVPEVTEGITNLLQNTDPGKTLVLHGGDFICGHSGTHTTGAVDITDVAGELFGGLHTYRHFAVVGNHDEEDLDFPRMRQYLEDNFAMHFMTQPQDSQTLMMEGKRILVHGIHTLLDHLQMMQVSERNALLDTSIHLLTKSDLDFQIVLIHNPDGLEYLLRRLSATNQRIETPTLFLAGHTHGSTLNLPIIRHGALRVCKTRYGRYKGWYSPKGKFADTGNWRLYVSTGMGNSPGFDFRINAEQEVVLFTL